MYSDAFPAAAFGVETNSRQGGFVQGGFAFGDEFGGGGAVPSIYNPYLASSADTHTRKCVPLSVSMIYRAYNENPGARIILNGEEIGHFKLVGRVRNFKSSKDGGAEKFSFDLVDDSGVIKTEWLVSYTAEGNSPWLQEYYDNFERRATESNLLSFYVKVFGECNLRGIHEPRVKANAVHIITNGLEVESHRQDTIIAHLTQPGSALASKFLMIKHDSAILNEAKNAVYTAPPVTTSRFSVLQPPPTPLTTIQARSSVPASGSVPPAQISRPTTPARPTPVNPTPTHPPTTSSSVKDNVHKFLLEMRETHPNGVHVKIIAHNAGTDIAGAREALKSLEEEGDAYYKKSEDWWTAI